MTAIPTTAAASARRTKLTATDRRIAGERRVYRRLIRFLLRDGGMVSINYGDGWDPDLRRLTDTKTLFDWFLATDEMTLRWRDREGNLIGGFYLVYGNSPEELIADYTANAQCEAAADHAYNERA